MNRPNAILVIAAIECSKGVIVLLAALGFLALIHHDVHRLAAALIEHAHLNPASKYPRIFVDAAASISDARLWTLAAGAAAYGLLRLVEGYGLYREYAWAEVLAALSGAVYVPFECAELLHRPGLLGAGLLAVNLFIVAFMVRALLVRRKAGRA